MIIKIINNLIFIDYLLSNSINSIPISSAFTSNITSLKEKIDIEYKEYLDAFYNPLGISDTILDLLKSMKDFLQQLKNEINKIKIKINIKEIRFNSYIQVLYSGLK